ncbi:hypothetical protein GCM10009548_22270 [Streptomyces malaysiensis subsp. malaysiensis]
MLTIRRATAVLATFAATTALSFTAAPAATAADATAADASVAEYGCSGSLIDTYPVRTSAGTTYGQIRLYYNSSTRRNCAVTLKNATGGYGTSSYASVTLYRCSTSKPGAQCDWRDETWDDDYGNFLYYAGPVSISAAGKCIRVFGQVSANRPIATGDSGTGGVHCG